MTFEARASCNLCEAMCGLRFTIDDDRPDPRIQAIRGDPEDVLSHGHLCPKGAALGELISDPDRLRTPLRRTARGFEPISWEEALEEAAQRISRVRRKYGKNAVGYYIGNPTVHSHRASLGSQVLAGALRTQNLFNPNSQDSNPRLFACHHLYGHALSMAVPDLERCQQFLILGANPAASQGSQMGLGDARSRFRAIRARGGRIVLIDPRRTETADWCDLHYPIRPGGDAALLLAMMQVLFAEGLVDLDAVQRISEELQSLQSLAARFPPERVADRVGIDAGTIRDLARLVAKPRSVVYGRVGVCQNEFGPIASWLIEAINVLTGNFDRPGGVMFPRPAADLSGLSRILLQNAFGRWRSRVRGLPEFLGALPSAVMAEEMETEGPGQIRALVCLAGNPVLSTPEGPRLERALAQLDTLVAVDFYLNETTRHAHLILPPLHTLESGNYELVLLGLAVRNIAKYSPPILPATPGSKDDWDILSELAIRIALPQLGPLRGWARRAARGLPERIVDLLLRLGPHGSRFIPGRRGLSLAGLAAAPGGVDLGPLEPSRERCVYHPQARVNLAPTPLMRDIPRLERWLDQPQPELVLIGRRHLRSNNSWMHNLPALTRGKPRSALLISAADARRLGLEHGAGVTLASQRGEVRARLEVSAAMMPGVVSLPHGFGHQAAHDSLRVAGALEGDSMNALTDTDRVEPVLGTSILSGVPVRVDRER